MRNRFINHARNVWDRAVELLPRFDHLWYKYAHMEEMLGNIRGARMVFERWMKWEPEQQSWNAFINFELRYGEDEHARRIYERYTGSHPVPEPWIKYAKFEKRCGNPVGARIIYERAIEELGIGKKSEDIFAAFAIFETVSHQYERARLIYKYAINSIPRKQAQNIIQQYINFENQFGSLQNIHTLTASKKRFDYEQKLLIEPLSYDTWFDYIRLEESYGDPVKIRDVYERAVANLPTSNTKRFWQRYIYLWINYALFEEINMKNMDKASEVYKTAIELIPHKRFTFAKLWVL